MIILGGNYESGALERQQESIQTTQLIVIYKSREKIEKGKRVNKKKECLICFVWFAFKIIAETQIKEHAQSIN